MSRHSFPLSRHIFLPSALHLCHEKITMLRHSFCGSSQPFVTIEFLIATCCCCRDIKLLCRDIVLLSCTVESELYVATDFENVATDFGNVATYFLP